MKHSPKKGKLLISVFTILLIIIAILFIKSWLQVKKLSQIENPQKYAIKYIPEPEKIAALERNCKFLYLFCDGDAAEVRSSLFPYAALQIQQIQNGSEDRYIEIDPIWNIFWVEISERTISTHWYGPWKIQ